MSARPSVGQSVSRLARLLSDPVTPPTETEVEVAEQEVDAAVKRAIRTHGLGYGSES